MQNINSRALIISVAIGSVFQVAMVIVGHSSPAVMKMFAVGGMGFSLIAGAIYGILAGRGPERVRAGIYAGAICAFIGILVSRLLGDIPTSLLVLGTVSSAVTGGLGGWISRMLPGR